MQDEFSWKHQDTFVDMIKMVRTLNEEKGWRSTKNSLAEYVALLHSEVSEVLEAWRDHHDAKPHFQSVLVDSHSAVVRKPVGVDSELADVLIRLLDMCDVFEVDLYAAFLTKMNFNATRPYQHGGRTLSGGSDGD